MQYTIQFTDNDKGSPVGKLADVEVVFGPDAGPFAGMKLVGFAIWEARNGTHRNVTFPARVYSVNGERRSYALLRPHREQDASDAIREAILAAYEIHQRDVAVAGAQS